MDDNATRVLGLSPLTVAVIGILTAATVLLTYHCVVARWCNNHQDFAPRRQRPLLLPVASTNIEDVQSSVENSIAELIPSYKYTKDIGLVSKTQDGTCAVCLTEFIDGEPVRVLPECLHPFHVSCIDMWLYSHSNCPLCRADTPPWGCPLGRRLESDALRV